MNIFGIGAPQIILILLIAAVLVGPEKLPYYTRKVARFMRQIRQITSNVTSELSKSIGLDDEDSSISAVKKDIADIRKSLEQDITDLKDSFSKQSKSISQDIESSTKGALDALQQSANDISKTFNPIDALENTPDVQTETNADDFGNTEASFDAVMPEGSQTVASPEVTPNTAIEPPKDKPLSTPIVTPKDTFATPIAAEEHHIRRATSPKD